MLTRWSTTAANIADKQAIVKWPLRRSERNTRNEISQAYELILCPRLSIFLHYSTAKLILLATLARSPWFWPSMQASLNLLLSHWAVQRAAPDFPGSVMLHFLPHLWPRAALAAAHATIVTNKAPMKTKSPVAKITINVTNMTTVWLRYGYCKLGFIWHKSGDIANKLRSKWYSPTARALCWKHTRKLWWKLGCNLPQLLRTHVRTFLESCLENPQNPAVAE